MRDLDLRAPAKRLQDNAVSFRQTNESTQLLLRSVRIQIELKPDSLKSDRHFFGDTEGSSEIQIAFRVNRAIANLDANSRGDSAQGHSRAGRQRLEQHVTRAGR